MKVSLIIITGLLVFSINPVSGQSLNKTFKYLDKGDILKSNIEIQKFSESNIKTNEELVLYVIANCLLTNNMSYQKYDPYKALDFFDEISEYKADNSEVNKFLSNYKLSIDVVNDMIFQNILSEAKNNNTEVSYQKALEVCKDCFYKDEVIKLKETSAYNEAKVKMSIEGYKYFISNYPSSEYSNEVKSLLEHAAFQDAKSQASVKSTNDYLKEYSRSENLYIPIAEHIRDSIIEHKEREFQARLNAKPTKLKEVLFYEQERAGDGRRNQYSNFPTKYYDGNQIFFKVRLGQCQDNIPWVINDNLEETKLEHGGCGSTSSITLIGESNRKEEFDYATKYLVPSIGSKIFHDIGTAVSSYNKKKFLMTKTYDIDITSYGASSKFQHANMISYDAIFKETNNASGEYYYCSRLSNNNILIVIKVNLEYLSNQLNSAFGIDGYRKFSRTISSSDYYKFLVISEDGSKIVSNKNYTFPFKTIKPIDDGFVIFSNKLGNLITLNENDFGKEIVLKNEFGKDVIVKENLSFSSSNNYKEGVKIFKFDNSANLVKELIIDNPSDDNIKTPIALNLQHSEDYFCVQYYSFNEEIVNQKIVVFKIFDFNLNLIYKYTYPANDFYNWDSSTMFTTVNKFYFRNSNGALRFY